MRRYYVDRIRGSRRRFFGAVFIVCLLAAAGVTGGPWFAGAAKTHGALDQDTMAVEGHAKPALCMKLKKGGTVRIELYPEHAPKTVERIVKLVQDGFYDGLEFHRVESFLVQTGKRDHDLEPLEGEMFGQKIWHEEGMVGMARLPTGYDTATTQFYILKERKPVLNGEYALFGRVIEGMEHIHNIKKGNKIESISLCWVE
jgi:peptidyl-prolyl cis-trans isomerase B (cyclophilin B)